ncbi:MAG: adenosylmethionine--8-amino-7-oxononanoate transaminase [Candidatus Omnitrophica bacterium]|nr:adenosylmethionine--8-amino-7-oxononanoate transaminase [Candidatus Omnitrophota bacterium]MDD5670312.1 adenosylmethionine--8-amino-7-oxononanoate transaminase [Candidatus Omnitrophota bacterium]
MSSKGSSGKKDPRSKANADRPKPSAAVLQRKDKKYLWHPFTQMRDWQKEDILIVRRGRGVYLEDLQGRRYLDGVSSLWCNVHGHCVPELDRAVVAQLKQIAHSTFLGLSNVPAIELAEKLISIAPPGLTRVFYSDSGSEAVEIALKMAFQYWKLRGKPAKAKFAKLTQAYHGDTLGSVSVGGIDQFHEIFGPLLFKTHSISAPYRYRWPTGDDPERVHRESLLEMERVLAENHEELAALVMEPLMQGAAGMIDQPSGYISRARELTKKYNVLLIFDEVATGFGRTGKMFASHHENVTPDLMTVAKGLTGGYLPLAATLATEEIYDAFLGEYAEFKAFFHGHTYTANPLACRVAVANLEIFEKRRVLQSLEEKIRFMERRLSDFYRTPCVGDIRQVGMMVGIELVRNRQTKETFAADKKVGMRIIGRARQKGAILRPLGPVIVLMPPLAMTVRELSRLLEITQESIREVCEEME